MAYATDALDVIARGDSASTWSFVRYFHLNSLPEISGASTAGQGRGMRRHSPQRGQPPQEKPFQLLNRASHFQTRHEFIEMSLQLRGFVATEPAKRFIAAASHVRIPTRLQNCGARNPSKYLRVTDPRHTDRAPFCRFDG
jgi:hypothetical protein